MKKWKKRAGRNGSQIKENGNMGLNKKRKGDRKKKRKEKGKKERKIRKLEHTSERYACLQK